MREAMAMGGKRDADNEIERRGGKTERGGEEIQMRDEDKENQENALRGFGPLDLLDADPRPCFVVALPKPPPPSTTPSTPPPLTLSTTHAYPIAYTNAALNSSGSLRDIVLRLSVEPLHAPFWVWLTAGEPAQVSFSHLGLFWTRAVVGGQWAVVNANSQSVVSAAVAAPISESPARSRESRDGGLLYCHGSGGSSLSLSGLSAREDGLSPQPLINPEAEPFLNVLHAVDWAETPLGPIDGWPARLQHTVSYVLSDSSPMAIYWGRDYTAIYNEAFNKLCCRGNAGLLGKSVLKVWPEMRQHMRNMGGGWPPRRPMSPIEHESRYFIDDEDGVGQETHVRWSMRALCDGEEFLGIVQSVTDTTRVRLWERRMQMLLDLGEVLISVGDVKSYWTQMIRMLGEYEPRYDVPFAILYSVQQDVCAGGDLRGGGMPPLYDCPHVCHLEGSLGLDKDSPLAPRLLRLWESEDGLSPTLRAAMSSCVPIVVSTRDNSLPVSLLKGVRWRGFGDACHSAVVYGIRPTREESPMGLLVLGLNPRRPYDIDYQQYVSLLGQKLRSCLAATVLIEDERQRRRNLVEQAAVDKKRLSEQLALRTQQATQSAERFRAVADFIPVGMCFGDGEGRVTYANDAWHRITGSPRGGGETTLRSYVVDEDQAKLSWAYNILVQKGTVTFEVRIRPGRVGVLGHHDEDEMQRNQDGPPGSPPPTPPDDSAEIRHVLASSKAELTDDGSILSVLTCVTDVTAHKQTAEKAVRVAQEAQNLKRMAEYATTGLYDMDMTGRLLSANNVFFELCGLPRVDLAREVVVPWPRCVVAEDVAVLEHSLDRLAATGKVQTTEVRLKAPWTTVDAAGNTIEAPRWVLVTMMMVVTRGTGGGEPFFTGCLSDVSLTKLQLEGERQRKEEAITSKRQQDNFIDITSHEMRNPLSAMILCADAIISSLTTAKGVVDGGATALMDESIENAETIVACAQHQRRIVDDILTMSKLDSKLLAVTPTTVDSVQITRDIIKMFEVEARRIDIELKFVLDPSYSVLGHDYLDFDPSRVKQVLINLLTNALKFTKGGFIRRVTVTLKASLVRPTEETAEVQFIPKTFEGEYDGDQKQQQESSSSSSSSSQQSVFLMFQVADSGQGLSDDETQKLFRRFVQANAKTHVKYGGSGLGLFISKRLVELQNGAIGVSSREGIGSLFAFYIEAHVPVPEAVNEARAATSVTESLSMSSMSSTLPSLVSMSTTTTTTTTTTTGVTDDGLTPHMTTAATTPRSSMVDLSPDPHSAGTWSTPSGTVTPIPGIPPAQAALAEAAAELGLHKILIVEDNVINQRALFRGLTKLGLTVEIANHGLEALERLEATSKELQAAVSSSAKKTDAVPIDMILMDVEMPVQDGLTCTRRIRELEADGEMTVSVSDAFDAHPSMSMAQVHIMPRVPIIALTANARSEQVEAAMEAGCDDVILKPYRVPELVDKMREVVQRVRVRE